MTNMISVQDDPRSHVKGLAESMQKELDRLEGEIDKHNQYEKTQIEKLTAAAAGGDAPGIETKEAETAREANKTNKQTKGS